MYRIIGGERGKWGKAAGFLIEVTTYETVVRIGGTGILLHLFMYIYMLWLMWIIGHSIE